MNMILIYNYIISQLSQQKTIYRTDTNASAQSSLWLASTVATAGACHQCQQCIFLPKNIPQTPAKASHSSFTTNKLAIVQAQQLVHLAFREISVLASLVLITVH